MDLVQVEVRIYAFVLYTGILWRKLYENTSVVHEKKMSFMSYWLRRFLINMPHTLPPLCFFLMSIIWYQNVVQKLGLITSIRQMSFRFTDGRPNFLR